MPPQEETDLRAQLAVMNTQIEGLTKTVDVVGFAALSTLIFCGGFRSSMVVFSCKKAVPCVVMLKPPCPTISTVSKL